MRTVASSGNAFVSRFDVGQISRTISAVAQRAPSARRRRRRGSRGRSGRAAAPRPPRRSRRGPCRRLPRRRGSSRRARPRAPSSTIGATVGSRSARRPGRGPAMSTPTMPRGAQPIAFSTMIVVQPRVKVRSIIRIRPARTCGYSRRARSSPRIAARMMWSRSRSPPRFRFIGLKRSSSVVIPCER